MQLFKKKKIVIDCITDNGFAFEFCRPDKAVKFIPNWWRELPGHSMNMKHCRGFTALYKNSFIYPSWTSFVLNMHSHKDRSFDWVCPDEFKIEPVSPHSLGGFQHEHHQIFRLDSPWRMICKEDVEFMWSAPVYSNKTAFDLQALPGLVNPHYTYAASINFNVPYKDNPYQIRVDAGDPLVCMTPLTEREVVFNYRLVSRQEILTYTMQNHFLIAPTMYHTVKNLIDRKESNKNKCPFHK